VAEIVWTAYAERDLRAVVQFVARTSLLYAEMAIDRIQAATDQLARFPESGRLLPEPSEPVYREIIVDPYRVIYRYDRDEERVFIAAIIHGRQRLPADLRDR
jgi:toxin ParE1/3/4